MTEILYGTDSEAAYVRSFRARVRALPPKAVVLDRSYFYPGGGGQPPDRGSLRLGDGSVVPVIDVGRSGPELLHRLGRAPGTEVRRLGPGDELEATIDWTRRFAHMRLHTAQHLASALLFQANGSRTRHAALSGLSATIELEAAAPTGAEEAAWKARFAEAVRAGRAVTVRHVPKEEYERNPAPRSGLVPLPSGLSTVRLIEIDGYDASPCGGTHLRNTREIGPVAFAPRAGGDPARVDLTLGAAAPDPSTPSG